MWDLSSLTRDRTHTPCIERQSVNHWTAREVSPQKFLLKYLICLNLLFKNVAFYKLSLWNMSNICFCFKNVCLFSFLKTSFILVQTLLPLKWRLLWVKLL